MTSSSYFDVIKEALQRRQEKEVHYTQVRQERWQELKTLADECDLLLDGRRKHNRQRLANQG
ncbi:MAG: hypothetical protein ACO1RX_07835 [Candidatus Sericytochromatia bacterium]